MNFTNAARHNYANDCNYHGVAFLTRALVSSPVCPMVYVSQVSFSIGRLRCVSAPHVVREDLR